MVSYKDIMMGFLEMERAGNPYGPPFVGPRLLDTCSGKPRGDRNVQIQISSTLYYLKLLTQMGSQIDSLVYFMPQQLYS